MNKLSLVIALLIFANLYSGSVVRSLAISAVAPAPCAQIVGFFALKIKTSDGIKCNKKLMAASFAAVSLATWGIAYSWLYAYLKNNDKKNLSLLIAGIGSLDIGSRVLLAMKLAM